MNPLSTEERLQTVRAYHQRTKHHYHAFARSLGYLDWANQPDPFRRFEGAEAFLLPFREGEDAGIAYDRLYGETRIEASLVNERTLGIFLQYSLGLSAWKEYQGSRWALRMNPSSGNLHPTEGYLVLPKPMEDSLGRLLGEAGGVFHYLSENHSLEMRKRFDPSIGTGLMRGFPEGAFLVGLSSIHWREAWKYGERAYRYCQHDVGHALGALALSAKALGWCLVDLPGVSDEDAAGLLGIDRPHPSHPIETEAVDLLVAVIPGRPPHDPPLGLPDEPMREIRSIEPIGTPNRLSQEHHGWDVIEAVHAACQKPKTESAGRLPLPYPPESSLLEGDREIHAGEVFAKRRSAVAMDGRSRLSREDFLRMLERTMPRKGNPVFESMTHRPSIHLLLFVHPLLDGLSPGLYFLARRPDAEIGLRESFRKDFLWTRPEGCPKDLPLFQLLEGDCRRIAESVSCGQAIAAEGVFSLGMIAEFDASLDEHGAWFYRRMFWETGAIGQILYLEAVAAGLSATGIGCFFDDPVHQILGVTDSRFQSLYHFTVGGAVEDGRLTTHPPYGTERLRQRGEQ